jgi:hypothetical protein
MIIPRKKQEILRPAMVASSLILLVFAVVACNNGAPEGPSGTGGADAKMAADKIAEAEPFYEGREDLTKARTAVTILRQAHAADYGNYEAAWKLARAAFSVGDRTDNDSERDDMFLEGIQAGKGAVQQTRGPFLAGRELRWASRTQYTFESVQFSGHKRRNGSGSKD